MSTAAAAAAAAAAYVTKERTNISERPRAGTGDANAGVHPGVHSGTPYTRASAAVLERSAQHPRTLEIVTILRKKHQGQAT
jgi:hypothetical protein